jgi:two-component system, NtrC family, response regulator AtoC
VNSGTATRNSALALKAERVLLVLERDGVTRYRIGDAQALTVGRSSTCDVVLRDPLASRLHLVVHTGEPLAVEDKGSQNGTLVRDERIPVGTRVSVELGDPVQIGGTMLLVQWAPVSGTGTTGVDGPTEGWPERVVIEDPSMRALYQLAGRVAKSNINVLVFGETGAGKELVAETVHRGSGARSRGPFVRINCAAVGEQIFESEMFGHERGSFTGAVKAKPGLLETAHTGTAFLDEVGELSLAMQAKLLRAVESHQVMRVGGLTPRAIDVRFVAATNRDLKAEVARGAFREDLYYRLAGVTLALPPLRERQSEIMPLVHEMARSVAAGLQRPQPRWSEEAKKCLLAYRWPGNVRQLRNVVECAMLRAEGHCVEVQDLPEDLRAKGKSGVYEQVRIPPEGPSGSSLGERVFYPLPERDANALTPQQQEERSRIVQGLAACNGNQTRTAQYLGMPRRTLVAKLVTYAIPRPRKASVGVDEGWDDQSPED